MEVTLKANLVSSLFEDKNVVTIPNSNLSNDAFLIYSY